MTQPNDNKLDEALFKEGKVYFNHPWLVPASWLFIGACFSVIWYFT